MEKNVYNRCDHVETTFSDRSDHSNKQIWKLLSDQIRNDRSTFLVVSVVIVAIMWKPALTFNGAPGAIPKDLRLTWEN